MNLPDITISKILSIFAKKEPKFKLQWYYLGPRDDMEKVLADFHDMLGESGEEWEYDLSERQLTYGFYNLIIRTHNDDWKMLARLQGNEYLIKKIFSSSDLI